MATTIRIQTTETQPFILPPTYVDETGPFEFVLDTGAAMSVLTKELADTIGVEGTEVKEALGAAGQKIEVPLGRVDSISTGESKPEDVQVGITRELPSCVGGRGALGYNSLTGFVLTVDYEGNPLTLSAPGDEKDQPRSPRTYVPLRLAKPDRPILLVEVLVTGRETYQFILDTGASQTVVSPELAQRAGIGKGAPPRSIIGAGGPTPSSAGTGVLVCRGRVVEQRHGDRRRHLLRAQSSGEHQIRRHPRLQSSEQVQDRNGRVVNGLAILGAGLLASSASSFLEHVALRSCSQRTWDMRVEKWLA